MKKVTSAALLALKLTWGGALGVFIATALVQIFNVYRELMPGGVPLQATFGFETLVRSGIQNLRHYWYAFLVFGLVRSAGATKGSKTIYTMRRLGLSEMQATLVFGLVFTGYFLLYWAFQLGLIFAFFAWFTRFSLVSSNALMLAAWRSEWFHYLLPLGEWTGYLRNVVICLTFGFSAAFGAHRARYGKFPLASAIPLLLCSLFVPQRMADSPDLLLIILLLVCIVVYYFYVRGGVADEDAL